MSVRRRALLLALEPTLSVEPLRGNVDTRLRKRGERGLDAVVLAAGLERLGLEAEIGHRFDPDEPLPEAGQGAVALQVREGEDDLVGLLIPIPAAAFRPSRALRHESGRWLPCSGRRSPRRHRAEGTCTARTAQWVERRGGVDPLAVADELLAAATARLDD